MHFGGKYRIIDFPLSNCANSHISTVGVLVQYESVLLSSYSAHAATWGLDSNGGGVYVLSPREKDETGLGLFKGTADAIYQNIDFLDQEEAEYVLVLSGDHIYKMDYEKMLEKHIEECEECKKEYEQQQKVSSLLDEVKLYYRAKRKKRITKLRAACAVILMMFTVLSFVEVAVCNEDLLDTLKYGNTLSAEDLGFPVDSYGLLMVDE